MEKPIIEKVVAYVTSGNRLLVFRHVDFPEAGIQVPAGTLNPGEDPIEGALREAFEESGLQDLSVVAYLGERMFDCTPYGKDQIHHRHFYHLQAAPPDSLPERWQHRESDPSDHSAPYYNLELWWATLPEEAPPLTGEQGALLPELGVSLLHAQFIRSCYNLARTAHSKGNHPFGALLVHEGQVILTAENSVCNDPVRSGADVTRHAEMNLVSLASSSLPPDTLHAATLYTSTEPCVMCTGAIYWAGIPEVVFGVRAETLAARAGETFVLNSRTILGEGRSRVRVTGPVLEAEGVDLFREWLAK